MKKSLEMRNNLENLKNEAQTLLDENKVKDAQDKMGEIKNLKNAIELQEALEKEEEETLAAENNIHSDAEDKGEEMPKNKAKKNANCIRAMIKKVTGGVCISKAFSASVKLPPVTFLKMTDNALIAYVVEVFAKKAVVTENKMIIAKLKENKTVKALKGWKDLKSSLNKDLDPAALFGTVIVTNQTGFDYLDSEVDSTGKTILSDDIANPTQKKFKGYTVMVYSDAMLPNTETKAPIFYGNLGEAIKFVDYNGLISFATSSEAGFMSNTTIARLIEFIDVIQVDKSDKCYIAGTIDTTVTVA